MNLLFCFAFIFCVCSSVCRPHEPIIAFRCHSDSCRISGDIYIPKGTCIARTLFPLVLRLEIERFDSSCRLDLSNLPNVKDLTLPDSHLHIEICNQIVNNREILTIHGAGGAYTSCQPSVESTQAAMVEQSLSSLLPPSSEVTQQDVRSLTTSARIPPATTVVTAESPARIPPATTMVTAESSARIPPTTSVSKETEDFKISTISLGVTVGGCVIVVVVAVICHQHGVLKLKSIRFGQLQIEMSEMSDINRSGFSDPILHSTTLSQLDASALRSTVEPSAARSLSDSSINEPRYFTVSSNKVGKHFLNPW